MTGIGKIVPHYLEDNYEDDNEYIELLLSNILVDERRCWDLFADAGNRAGFGSGGRLYAAAG